MDEDPPQGTAECSKKTNGRNEMNTGCHVMVLGGAGFIGRTLSRYLAQMGYKVSVFDLVVPEDKDPDIKYYAGKFFDDQTLETLTDGQDIIIHALSTVNPGNSNRNFMQGYTGDFIQTVKLFDLACRKDIRVIFLSSAGTVYGRYDGQPFSERHALQPINHYGSVKVCVTPVRVVCNNTLKQPCVPSTNSRADALFPAASPIPTARARITGKGSVSLRR